MYVCSTRCACICFTCDNLSSQKLVKRYISTCHYRRRANWIQIKVVASSCRVLAPCCILEETSLLLTRIDPVIFEQLEWKNGRYRLTTRSRLSANMFLFSRLPSSGCLTDPSTRTNERDPRWAQIWENLHRYGKLFIARVVQVKLRKHNSH